MPPAISAEVRICPSAWLLTRMLLAAALEQSAVGMARPTISGRRAMRVRRPISSASTICHWRASISPPQKAAMPTMANSRPKVSSFMKILSASEGCPLACVGRTPPRVPLAGEASAVCVAVVGASLIRRESTGICRMNQHEQTAARTNQRTQPGRFHGGMELRAFIVS